MSVVTWVETQILQCGHDVHEETGYRSGDIDRLSSKFLAEGSGDERKERETESVHGQPERRLELGRVQVARHGGEAQGVCA